MRLISDDALGTLTIWTEAQGETYIGKVAVGEVIRRRTRQRYSSDGTVAGTVAKRYQFSAWNDDAQDNALLIKALNLDDLDPIVRACEKAWKESEFSNYSKGAVLYCNLKTVGQRPAWATQQNQVAEIGNHTFFRA